MADFIGSTAVSVGKMVAAEESLGEIIQSVIADLMVKAGLHMMAAGAEMLATSAGINPAGWALLVGGAALAGLGGYVGASGSGSAGTGNGSDSPAPMRNVTPARSASLGSFTASAPGIVSAPVVVNVHGSVVTERQLVATIDRARQL